MGYGQVKPQPADEGFSMVKPKRAHPPHPNGGYSQLGNYLNMQSQTPDAGFEQLNPPDAGFEHVRDKEDPAARAYAKQRLMALVHRGVIPRYLPEWDKDPTAAWRAISKMVFQPQAAAGDVARNSPPADVLHDTDWSGFGTPSAGVSELAAPAAPAQPENMMTGSGIGGIDSALMQLIGQALLKRRGTRSAPGVA